MIEDIENHFKNKIFFTSSREFREYDTLRMGASRYFFIEDNKKEYEYIKVKIIA